MEPRSNGCHKKRLATLARFIGQGDAFKYFVDAGSRLDSQKLIYHKVRAGEATEFATGYGENLVNLPLVVL